MDGHAGRVIELDPVAGQKVSVLVSIDRITNRFEAIAVDKINIPQTLKGVDLTAEQMKDLREGKQILVRGMVSKQSQEAGMSSEVIPVDESKAYVAPICR